MHYKAEILKHKIFKGLLDLGWIQINAMEVRWSRFLDRLKQCNVFEIQNHEKFSNSYAKALEKSIDLSRI